MKTINNTLQYKLYEEQEKHLVAIDNVIFGYSEGKLMLLLYPRSFEPAKGNWSLIGGFLQEDESSCEAASRILKRITGLSDIYVEQFAVFSNPQRETAVRVVSIVYYALIRLDQYNEAMTQKYGAEWFPAYQYPNLIFDHENMVQTALEKLRHKALVNILGQHLLPEMFTITQLRQLYEAIFQREIDPGNFRKKILSSKILTRLDEKNITESRKGAYYYKYICKQEGNNDIVKNINIVNK